LSWERTKTGLRETGFGKQLEAIIFVCQNRSRDENSNKNTPPKKR